MAKIEDLLQRRTDLSTFLVHLTREGDGNSALENLISIIDSSPRFRRWLDNGDAIIWRVIPPSG